MHRQAATMDKKRTNLSRNCPVWRGQNAPNYQWPVFCIEAHGSFGGSASPFCNYSIE
jgi:hypothetical protein